MTLLPYIAGSPRGWIHGSEYRKCVYGSKHLMRKTDSWGIDTEIFNDIVSKGIKEIVVKDIETQEKYRVSIEKFKEKAWEENWDTPQMFLPRSYWTIEPKHG